MISLDNTVDAATLLKIIQDQQLTIEKLSARLEQLLHLLYGTRTEKRRSSGDEKEEADKKKSAPKAKDTQEQNASKGRRPLPFDLARVRIIHDLPLEKQYCPCGCKMNRMGQITTEQLDLKPAELFIKEHVRYKYVCRACEMIVSAPLPPQLIEKGLPGPGLLAEVIVNKYQDALPLYRQEQRFGRLGIELNCSTLCD